LLGERVLAVVGDRPLYQWGCGRIYLLSTLWMGHHTSIIVRMKMNKQTVKPDFS